MRYWAFLLLTIVTPSNLRAQGALVSPYQVRAFLDTPPTDLWSPDDVRGVYRSSGFRLVWTSAKAIAELKAAIVHADEDGLRPGDYHLEEIEKVNPRAIEPHALIAKDVYLTDAYLALSRHLKRGRVNGAQLFPADWDPVFSDDDFVLDLLQALHDQTIASTIEGSKPKFPFYCQMKDELAILRSVIDTLHSDSLSRVRNLLYLNMEKVRWLGDLRTTNGVWVNIPSFQFTWRDRDSILMDMKAIVGRPERKTPILNSQIRSVVINPEWVVPPTILKEDVLPAVQVDVAYLQKNRLRLVDHDGLEIAPDSVNWSKLTADKFPYSIKQDAGTRSALGLLKFQFANRHGVYIHDTNMHPLFTQANRALSSGCIRIEKPFLVASRLLTNWSEKALRDSVDTGKTYVVTVARPIQVHTTYFTITTSQGRWKIWDDLYGWDRVIEETLKIQGLKQRGSAGRDNR